MPDNKPALCFIGFGEAGQAIAAGLRDEGVVRVAAWDILFPEAKGEKLKRAADAIGVRRATSAADAIHDADVIVSAVTAAASVDAALSVKPHLAGPHAEAVAPLLAALSMRASIAGPGVGAAAAIKMIRSVIMKGMEALTLECFLGAARAGVVDEVAASLKNNYPGLDWAKVIPYNLERMASHGERRAAEMEEVAATHRELGVEPLMTTAIVKRQREMGEIGAQQSVRSVLDKGRAAILSAISAAAHDRH